jgi:hypothetical protein
MEYSENEFSGFVNNDTTLSKIRKEIFFVGKLLGDCWNI